MPRLDLGKVVPEKGVDYFTEADKQQMESEIIAEIDVPTKTSDLTNDSGFIDNTVNNLINYELKTNTGALIDLSIDSSTYVITLSLKNSAGTILNTKTIDLPLESVVVNGRYDSTNKKIVLTLESGATIDIPVGDLVSGLQSEITSTNKLSSDLVDDTNSTNKFVTANEKTTWGAKYDKPLTGIPKTDLSNDVQASLGKADSAIQDISGKEDKSNKVTSLSSSFTDTEYPSAKATYDACGLKDNYYINYLEINNVNTKTKIMNDLQKIIRNISDDETDVTKYMSIILDLNNYKVLLTSQIRNFDSNNGFYDFREDSRRMWNYSDTTGVRTVRISYSNGTVTNVQIFNDNLDNYYKTLSIANTNAYTPTGDYNPATKKYVDDLVGDISTVLSNLVTVNNGGGE